MKFIKLFEEFNYGNLTKEDIMQFLWYPGDNKENHRHKFYFQCNDKEDADDICDEILDIFNNLGNKMTVYRAIYVSHKSDINKINHGIHWSLFEDSAIDFGMGANNFNNHGMPCNYLMKGIVDANDVNWYDTIENYCQFTLTNPDSPENEITVKEGCVKNIKIKIIKY